jgi:hypothetical protein
METFVSRNITVQLMTKAPSPLFSIEVGEESGLIFPTRQTRSQKEKKKRKKIKMLKSKINSAFMIWRMLLLTHLCAGDADDKKNQAHRN